MPACFDDLFGGKRLDVKISAIDDVAARDTSAAAQIWLHPAAMTADDVAAGDMVAVVCSDSHSAQPIPPLQLAQEALQLATPDWTQRPDWPAIAARLPGLYCALATVWPAPKIPKSCCRLSWQLADSLGRPEESTRLYVFTLKAGRQQNLSLSSPQAHGEQAVVQPIPCRQLALTWLEPLDCSASADVDRSAAVGGEGEGTKSGAGGVSQKTPIRGVTGAATQAAPGAAAGAAATSLTSPDRGAGTAASAATDATAAAARIPLPPFLLTPAATLIGAREREGESGSCSGEEKEGEKTEKDEDGEEGRGGGAAAVARRVAGDLRGITLGSVGGLEEQKKALKEAVLLPLRHPDLFHRYGMPRALPLVWSTRTSSTGMGCLELFPRYGIKPPRGILLHGPPGTGKTSLARAVAAEAGAALFVINGPELVSEFFGESEEALNEVFSAAQEAAPSIVNGLDATASVAIVSEFFGESEEALNEVLDAKHLSHRMVAALLTILDAASSPVLPSTPLLTLPDPFYPPSHPSSPHCTQVFIDELDAIAPARTRDVFIDELDAIAPARTRDAEDLSHRMVAALLTILDGTSSSGGDGGGGQGEGRGGGRGEGDGGVGGKGRKAVALGRGVVVIGATNRVNAIDPALRRPGRFDREVEIGIPTPSDRLAILSTQLSCMAHALPPEAVHLIASSATHGFVGADISALCSEAAVAALRRIVGEKERQRGARQGEEDQEEGREEGREKEQGCSADSGVASGAEGSCAVQLAVCEEDFEVARRCIRPSALRELAVCEEDFELGDAFDLTLSERCMGQGRGGGADGEVWVVAVLLNDGCSPPIWLLRVAVEVPTVRWSDIGGLEGDKAKAQGGSGVEWTYPRAHGCMCLFRPPTHTPTQQMAVEVPTVRWSDIGGLEGIKQRLKEAVEWPYTRAHEMRAIGATPPRGLLLYGPPGCSKTLLAKAVATEARLNFLAVKGPELLSKWVGESERAVRTLFSRAKAAAPAIVFFDEIDGLAVARSKAGGGASGGVGDRVMTQLLLEMDGEWLCVGPKWGGGRSVGRCGMGDRVMTQLLLEMDALTPSTQVTVIAATNRPDLLDRALLRPGRFDRLLFVPPPDLAAREKIFALCLRGTPLHADVDSCQLSCQLAARSEGYTGADITAICREAKLAALEVSWQWMGMSWQWMGMSWQVLGMLIDIGWDELAVGGDELAVGGDELAVGGDELAVGGDELAVGGDELAVDGDELAVGGDELAVDGDELAVDGDERVYT
ncbi:unnamed protein product [Closterium sp. NIES-65]|nr:unnamed protein product [Closterium sp. NIES-65]